MKIKLTILASFLYLIILFITYYIHINFFNINVIFYSALYDVLIATIISIILIYKMPPFRLFNRFEKNQFLIIWLLTGYALAISLPTLLDRSLSFYLLEKIQQRGGGIEQKSFEEIFTNEYMIEFRLIDVRLTEQIESGTIEIKDGCVKLTKTGKILVLFSSYFRHNLLSKHRLLMGEYTDELTNPFRNSNSNISYVCNQ